MKQWCVLYVFLYSYSVNPNLGNKFRSNLNQNTTFFIKQNSFENGICQMLIISSWPPCVRCLFCCTLYYVLLHSIHIVLTVSNHSKHCSARHWMNHIHVVNTTNEANIIHQEISTASIIQNHMNTHLINYDSYGIIGTVSPQLWLIH